MATTSTIKTSFVQLLNVVEVWPTGKCSAGDNSCIRARSLLLCTKPVDEIVTHITGSDATYEDMWIFFSINLTGGYTEFKPTNTGPGSVNLCLILFFWGSVNSHWNSNIPRGVLSRGRVNIIPPVFVGNET